MKRLFEIDPWNLTTHQLSVSDRRLQESLTAIGNGYMGMRGNFEEAYSGDHHQGTYLGGIWFPDKTRVGWWKNGYPEYFGKAINAPNFLSMPITINGQPLDLATCEFNDFQLKLDMKTGILTRHFIYVNGPVEVAFDFERFLSIEIKEIAVISVKATVLQGDADIIFEPKLDGNVTNEDANYEENFWDKVDQGMDTDQYLTMITAPNPFDVPRFTVTYLMDNQVASTGEITRSNFDHAQVVGQQIKAKLAADQSITLTKYVAVVTSRDIQPVDQVAKAQELAHKAVSIGIDSLREHQAMLWQKRWATADVAINGNDIAQQGIRFNIFQLFMTYYGDDSRLNIGPKGFTGEKYGGATYWDTEAYIMPMYLSITDPKVSRQLLQYRHDQLSGAYHNAAQQGLRGALYPMVTFNGIECHNEWEITFEEIHRNGAIAHAIYAYTNYTGDESYVLNDGIEVLVGISRFWADRVHFSQRKQQYMIHGVTGPNEYENNVNNNWYTNQMAAWTLRYTLSILPKLTQQQIDLLDISESETNHWQDIANRMYFPHDDELGIFVQHDTFLDKDLRPASSIPAEQRPINQHWSWDHILRSPFIKQADVLQGIYFLNTEFTQEEKELNFDFYEPLTVHESSLSPCIHAILAAELGKEEKAVELYERTARLDLDNYNNDTDDGLHITSMSGSWLAIVQGFAGMRTDHDQLRFKPFCPKAWTGYQFKILYRKRLLAITVDHQHTDIHLISGDPLTIFVNDQPLALK